MTSPAGPAAPLPPEDAAAVLPPEARRDLRRLAERLAQTAGDLVRGARPARVEVAATKSTPTDVVTRMDRDVEDLLRRELAAARPGDAVLGEEGGLDERGRTGLTWVVDPVDGTVNYLYGLPGYAVSVAVVSGPPDPATWVVEAGAVHDVVGGRTWSAHRGGGATCDGVPLDPAWARDDPDLARCLTGTGFGYDAARRRHQAEVLVGVLPVVRDIRRLGAAAVDLCRVASGELDLYFERGLQPWDHAAGGLVAVEAGAVVRGLGADRPTDRMVVAGSPRAAGELATLLERLDAGRD
ncbi:inositol monophosphatase family protein [Luteimicrobium subarcticum]|uniref:inositol monophosphatase family protein n=1 Tax=Luteimicrobium subarcticum TaxID=620910 RepID=UPI0031831E7B